MCTVNGQIVYENVITEFPCGSVYYIDKAYTGAKSLKDIDGFNTPYLLGKRKELIISNDEFNKSSSFRWTIPIQTLHRSADSTKGVMFRDKDGDIKLLKLDQLRCRHVSDMLVSNGAYYCYRMDDDLINHISNILTSRLPNNNPYILEMKVFNTNVILDKIHMLEERITQLENQSKSEYKEEIRKEKRRNWDEKTKKEFLTDYEKLSVKECAEKYGISVSSVYKYGSNFSKELNS